MRNGNLVMWVLGNVGEFEVVRPEMHESTALGYIVVGMQWVVRVSFPVSGFVIPIFFRYFDASPITHIDRVLYILSSSIM